MGVPNKSKIIGYLGSYDATFWQKIAWNIQDWLAKFQGRFENELGAHASFTRKELKALLKYYFTETQFVTEDYFRKKYSGRIPARILNFLFSPGLFNYATPTHYALCRKE